jgi:hypothetical protein
LLALPLLLVLAAQPGSPAGRPSVNPARPAVAANPAQEFARGRTAFDRGEYARTIQLLRPLLYPEVRLESEGEIVQTHRMLGIAHLYERQNEQAAQEFRNLLQLRPDYRMDRMLDPPAVVEFYNAILKQQETELADLERKRQQADLEAQRRLEAARNGPTVVERHFVRNSMAVSFIPFGAGQFQNGQPGKGWVFLGAEAALATVSIAAFTANFAIYGVRPSVDCERSSNPAAKDESCSQGFVESPARSRSQLLLRVQLISGALFFATAIWGVTDAVLNFRQQVMITPTLEPAAKKPEGQGQASRRRGPRAGEAPRISLMLVGDGQLGGGLAFRF